ncbi:hypothetical protein [Tenacibaculum finnmarkense]|uniref:hypothetical protein n=1 Tax=Tenacibaculum finnmarkense TaxID=2781243 RepID=UPI0011AFBA80|nr:hypothetical protein [Tenacibaculum finnmarkense]MCG8732206.1 hypothetical protein [Tenacibaculum finnmarkense]MCG8752811.1 hypothetical protein [Tenacibaculum finnmarkense]MCG8773707.1 hypothetical protein [Tenacibaculum finnmarkense]MCG8836568.1 hypothetical protein [Tenacibaculum finnmarkense]
MNNFFKVSVVAIVLMFASCSDDAPTVFDNTLTVNVFSFNNGTKMTEVYGAKVFVYKSLQDLADEENVVTQGLTDEKGQFETSKNIEKGVNYFVDIEKGCQNNYVDIFTGKESSYKSKRTTDSSQLATISIEETGTVKLVNGNEFDVLVLLDNVEVATLNAADIYTGEYDDMYLTLHAGSYSGLKLVNTNTNEEMSSSSIKITCNEEKKYLLDIDLK